MAAMMLMPPAEPAVDPSEETAIADRFRRISAAIATMRTESDRALTLDELAEAASYSRFHFVRTFRDVVGTSPGAFQTAIRFARASELLLTSSATITEICGEVGYNSLGTFSERFRGLVGVSPSGLRELPHQIAELPSSGLDDPIRAVGPRGEIVRVAVPETCPASMSIYVGLYRDGVASGIPVAGAMTSRPGVLELDGLAPGSFHLLAAAFPAPIHGLGHLLPGDHVQVSSSGRAIHVTGSGASRVAQPLHRLRFRPIAPTDAPILTALPALVLSRMT